MKKIVATGFSLTPQTRVMDFSTFNGFDIKKLYTIVDVKRNQVIYSLGTKGFGYSNYDSNTKYLTLQYNTANIAPADPITVVYEVDGKFDQDNAIPAVMAPGEILRITGYNEVEGVLEVKQQGNIRIDGYDAQDQVVKTKLMTPVVIQNFDPLSTILKVDQQDAVETKGYDSTNDAVRTRQTNAYDSASDSIKISANNTIPTMVVGQVETKGYDSTNNVVRTRQTNAYDPIEDVIQTRQQGNIRIDGYDATGDVVKVNIKNAYESGNDTIRVQQQGNIRIDGYDVDNTSVRTRQTNAFDSSKNAIRITPEAPLSITTSTPLPVTVSGQVELLGYDVAKNAIRTVHGEAYDIASDSLKVKQQGNIRIDGYDLASGAVLTKPVAGVFAPNEIETFRDEFSNSTLNPTDWTITKDPNDFVYIGGNVDGSSYVSIIKNYVYPDTTTEIYSRAFSIPARVSIGVSVTARNNGLWFGADFVEVDGGVIQKSSAPSDGFISGISITSNVWTVTTTQDIVPTLKTNDIILIHSAQNTLLNVGPVWITVVSRNQFSFSWTAANGTFTTAAGSLGPDAKFKVVDPIDFSRNGFGVEFDNTSANTARFTTRNNTSATYSISNNSAGLTNISSGLQTTAFANKPYTYSFKPNRFVEMFVNSKSAKWDIYPDENQTTSVFTLKKHLPLPDLKKKYALRFQSKNLTNLPFVYKGLIQTIQKTSGSTTVTVTTSSPHGLSVGNAIVTGGFIDVTNFPALTTPVTIATVPSATTFTYTQAAAATATATGNFGKLFVVNGQGNTNVILPLVFSSRSVTNNLLTLVSTAASSFVIGVHYQMFSTDTILNSIIWRCAVVSGTTTVFEPVNVANVDNYASSSENVVMVVANEYRIHVAGVQSFQRNIVEIAGNWGNTRDADEAGGVNVLNTPNIGTVTTVTSVGSITNPITVNCLTQYGPYTTSIPNGTNIAVLANDLGATATRNKVNAVVIADGAVSLQVEHSLDNLTWFTAETSATAATITTPVFSYTAFAAATAPTVTISNGNPAVVTFTGHPFETGTPVTFATTGTLPAGLTAGTAYYIRVIDANSFHLYDTLANASGFPATTGIRATTNAGSGTHTITSLRTFTIPNTHTLLRGMAVTAGGAVGEVVTNASYPIGATSVVISTATAPTATGTITVTANSVFRASQIALPVLGRYVRLRLTNNGTKPTAIMYATLSALQN